MPEKKSFLFNGKQVTGESIAAESANEPWAQFTLADGTAVKARLVLLDAVRLDAYTDTGDPVYQFQFQQIIGVMPAEKLKRKVQ